MFYAIVSKQMNTSMIRYKLFSDTYSFWTSWIFRY